MKYDFGKLRPVGMMLCSWLVPGLGHFLQKKKLKALIFFCGIAALLIMGLVMQGKFWSIDDYQPIKVIAFLGGLANGLFYIIIKIAGLAGGSVQAATFHYGTAYMTAAGFMNILVGLNAYDIAVGRK